LLVFKFDLAIIRLLKQLNLKIMKTRLFSFLVLLLSITMSGQTGIVRGNLSSNEIENGDFFCGGSRGAYFNLTLSNRELRNLLINNGINTPEYVSSDYMAEDSFGSGPVAPITSSNLSNYRSCNALVISFKLQNVNDPAVFYRVEVTLKVIPRPTPKPIYYYTQVAGGSGDYFYTQNYNAIGNGSIAGFRYIGVAFNAYYSSVARTIPIYRYFNPQTVNHFYTRSPLSRTNLVLTGLQSEGVEFYAYPNQSPGTIPVYRYYSPSLQNHFYTTDFSTYGNGRFGYDYEGIEFYAFPPDPTASRMMNSEEKDSSKLVSDNNIVAYPNPTSGLINIKNNSKTIDEVSVNNMFGETVQTKKLNSTNADLDLSNLPKGIYFVKVKSEGEEKVMRIVKE
jgi:Secretion system C-terminal sorting domain/Repeat of unknown function (DUF5648)